MLMEQYSIHNEEYNVNLLLWWKGWPYTVPLKGYFDLEENTLKLVSYFLFY